MKKLVIAAGTGFLGQVLIAHFKDIFTDITVLTRGKNRVENNIRYVTWDAQSLTGWEAELEGADVLINLAGKSVDCRYNERNKNEIITSRLYSTVLLNKAALQCSNPPKHWLNASTATIYRHSEDKRMTEANGETGSDFSMNVAKVWENAFFRTETPRTLKTALRTSIVLGNSGGAFPPLKQMTKMLFGGRQGNGNQMISWIHEKDFARAAEFIITTKMEGVVNVTAPAPIRNRNFMKLLRRALKIPFGIPIGRRLLGFGAWLIGTETELVLKSRNVIPQRLSESGFTFEYPTLKRALNALIKP